ncbi:uncharacterized protein K02A2.6-like [Setaria italica]|uniref:uncharacterized protein K02A2.6-like n=1 Tax=Setaria italica TaxID=4555 RepID=UPI000350D60F|nr:uncharacterized protein K02A2.6-like [Setaria italica]
MGPGVGARVVLISLEGNRLYYAICLHFKASKNIAEYETLINGLRIAIELGATRLYVRGDLELVVDQVMKESSYKSPFMVVYFQEVRNLEEKVVRRCKGCEFYARQTHLSALELQAIPITWPFAVWGLYMVKPHKKASRGHTHLLIVVDKFTKWIEAKPITNIRSQEAVEFFLDIIYRFSVPNYIITNNGTYFTGKKFLDFCDSYGIRVD